MCVFSSTRFCILCIVLLKKYLHSLLLLVRLHDQSLPSKAPLLRPLDIETTPLLRLQTANFNVILERGLS